MSQRITIQILDKIATCLTEAPVVCGNSDYVVDFDFDEEWNEHNVKTAVFKVNGETIREVFEGTICKMPVFQNTLIAWVGVFAGTIDDGTLSTSTPALIRCKPCVTDGDDPVAPPQDDVYNQIVDLCEGAVVTAKSVEDRANNGEFKGEKGEKGEKGDDGAIDEETLNEINAQFDDIGERLSLLFANDDIHDTHISELREQVSDVENTANDALENASSARYNSEEASEKISELENQMGDIETALDAIIEIQGNLIGE